jgi:hypothetical protein
MHRRDILKSAASVAALGSAGLGRPAIAQGAAKTLRFVPQANLGSLDPIWTTAGQRSTTATWCSTRSMASMIVWRRSRKCAPVTRSRPID